MSRPKTTAVFIPTVAQEVGLTLNEFYQLFLDDDWVQLLQLGWRPFIRKLTPAVLDYIDTVILARHELKRH
jgi:hypothetical protein